MEEAKELLELFENKNCDYNRCRDLIREIGGCTRIIEDSVGLKTTPLHEAISCGHYDFAIELIGEPGADLDVDPDGWGTVMWGLQHFDAETEEEQYIESENKLRLMRALINAGANPDPKGDEDGEELLYWIRYKLNEGEGNYHLWQMEHMIEAHAYGETERFLTKLREQEISRIMLSDFGYWLMDDDLCDCDHAVFLFEDGDRMVLSSYQVGDDEWNFYAVPVRKNLILDPAKHHTIAADNNNSIKFLSWYVSEDCPKSHWLDLSIDDAILRIHANEPNITVGIVCHDFNDYEKMKRKNLFLDKE